MVRPALIVAVTVGLVTLTAPFALDGQAPAAPTVLDEEVTVRDGTIHVTRTVRLPGSAGDGSSMAHSVECGGTAPFTAKCTRQLELKSVTILIGIHVDLGYTGVVLNNPATSTGGLIWRCDFVGHVQGSPLDDATVNCDNIVTQGSITAGQSMTLRGLTQTVDMPQSVGQWSVSLQNKNH